MLYSTSGSLSRCPDAVVPIPLAGAWKRTVLEAPLGDTSRADRSTVAFRVQSRVSSIYMEVIIPSDSPGRSLRAAQLSNLRPRPSALAALGLRDSYARENYRILQQHLGSLVRQKAHAGTMNFRMGDWSATPGIALRQDHILRKWSAEHERSSSPPFRASSASSSVLSSTVTTTANSNSRIHLGTCTWRCHLRLQPPSQRGDEKAAVSLCTSNSKRNADGSILVRETSADASQAAGYLCLPSTCKGPFFALELLEEIHENAHGAGPSTSMSRSGYWLRAGNRFGYIVGRPSSESSCFPLPSEAAQVASRVGDTLGEALTNLTNDTNTMLDVVNTHVALIGEVSRDSRWKISHSTQPELVGCLLVGPPPANSSGSPVENQHIDELEAHGHLICSHLSLMQTEGETGQGGVVEQVIPVGSSSNEPVGARTPSGCVKRRWKVTEISGCSVPFI